jgi:hypothetical protein
MLPMKNKLTRHLEFRLAAVLAGSVRAGPTSTKVRLPRPVALFRVAKTGRVMLYNRGRRIIPTREPKDKRTYDTC